MSSFPTRLFVTGTDTEVGKTFVSSALLIAAQQAQVPALGLKPIAAGADYHAQEAAYYNQDALDLQKYASITLDYEQVNPVMLKAATAPHIAAAEEGRRLNSQTLLAWCRGALWQRPTPEFALVEGAGGWYVPLNARETLADLAKALNFPVLLVVDIRLGCINHALLTAQAIARDGLPLVAWVANCRQQEMPYLAETLATLEALLPAPCWAKLPPCSGGVEQAAEFFEFLFKKT
ncbi:dethiobiotin synthetase [Allopseudospirillum japonicum]|uniref:ATP-dependent dethiobiotin synthetase BioD n=1 Tax=Allopseudospirillum japonicum TaxID=64971 RepID=A0A1H6QN69_9GAMM|nr:dethiobiotin synthase [Allopseudospirillum japonicum]SEI40910.1 dethiobiotin synthetase [Allopseudospirillum japonicum]